MITTPELMAKYGKPNESGTPYLVKIDLPYPMVLSWDKSVSVKSIKCHKLVAEQFKAIFAEILQVYGYDKVKELNIDVYGGCFNFRKMRGGSDWSRHSWGVAIDLSPEKNALKTRFAYSQFAKPEYAQLHAIFEKNGFENLGKVKGYDAMHWQVKQ